MRITSLLLSAVAVSFALCACDDGDALPADAELRDRGPSVPRDLGAETGPVDVAPMPIGPDIDISPGQLALVADPGERSAPGGVRVANAGDAPLTVSQIAVDGADFELQPIALPAVIEPGGSIEVAVVFAPDMAGERQGLVTITSDDPDELRREIPLSGRNPETCIRAMPSSVNLGSVAVGGESARFRVQIVNCGDRPATIGEVGLDGAEGFAWARTQGPGDGEMLRPGNVLILEVWYLNAALGADDTATATLVVPTDLPTGDVRINVAVRGGGGPTCDLVVEPAMVDFETLRIGLVRNREARVVNRGTAHCELRGLVIEQTDGPEENRFEVVRGVEGDRIEGGAEQTIEVAYAPLVADPVGDRGELRLSFHDPHRVQNRTATALLRGVGAQALVGPIPEAVETGVTTTGCFSWRRAVRVANVGFVPICLTGYRYEGDACDRFARVEEPVVPEGECIALGRGEDVTFSFRHGPEAVGDDLCTLVVESDAQNTPELSIPVGGTGTDTAETVDERVVGDLNRRRNADFPLSRPCDGETLRLFVNDEETDRFAFSAQRNALVFEADQHPADEGDTIRMEYEAICYQLDE